VQSTKPNKPPTKKNVYQRMGGKGQNLENRNKVKVSQGTLIHQQLTLGDRRENEQEACTQDSDRKQKGEAQGGKGKFNVKADPLKKNRSLLSIFSEKTVLKPWKEAILSYVPLLPSRGREKKQKRGSTLPGTEYAQGCAN